MSTPACHIINLQPALGGGEVYTMTFARAVRAAGCRAVLFVRPGVDFWRHLEAEGVEIVPAARDMEVLERLPSQSWIVTHGPVSRKFVLAVKAQHWLTGFCHMPLAGRSAGVLAEYDLVYAVSQYVLSTLGPAGVPCTYAEPLPGIAEFARGASESSGAITRNSVYSWDQRKFRDRMLSLVAPLAITLADALRPRPVFQRRAGVTLGIVSNIGPIKQFDQMFRILVPHLAARPTINLEIFGNGGYRSAADLQSALRPLRGRARFWGPQPAPEKLYGQMDFLMSGLPEKEALGLNLIEAQVCGTPVLAIDAPPFTETVLHGVTGYLYRDPRNDGGAGFAATLDQALAAPRLHPQAAVAHLERFARPAFNARAARLVAHAAGRLAENSEWAR